MLPGTVNLTCAVGHRHSAFVASDLAYRAYCNASASECLCSAGCGSSWSCRPSSLCDAPMDPAAPVRLPEALLAAAAPPRVAILLFLAFNRSLVRNKYAHRPHAAYDRELVRILWFVQSARRANTTLPIHVVVGPERDAAKERVLLRHGVHLTVGPRVVPPPWAGRYHRLSFSKIGALALTQFDKVFVFDNDMAIVHNVDHLARAETPSAVWHPAVAKWQWRHNESCAVTTGLLGLTPSRAEFDRAMRRLHSMGDRSVYDGGDQEFWRTFYTWYELPNRYQAHQALNMPYSEWRQVRVLHAISGLRDVSRIPRDMRHLYTYVY